MVGKAERKIYGGKTLPTNNPGCTTVSLVVQRKIRDIELYHSNSFRLARMTELDETHKNPLHSIPLILDRTLTNHFFFLGLGVWVFWKKSRINTRSCKTQQNYQHVIADQMRLERDDLE